MSLHAVKKILASGKGSQVSHLISQVASDALNNRHSGIGPSSDKKLFPVHRPSGLKRADWDFSHI